ncbi:MULTISPECIES: hypothetical protein [Streptomyces]|uniref:Urease subunit alpha n=1 Tax=Streptomyces viridochromogenes TaxID=1938 RepID=A0A0L8LF17_STRVR|nr:MULTISPECIES: hypothetical protein [Streptomyces]KOG36704.1 hypothetical protein ADK34_00225 [Streptomyces viridochromogenes]
MSKPTRHGDHCAPGESRHIDPQEHVTFGSPHDTLATRRGRVAVRGTRGIGPADMLHNARLGQVDVDPRSGLVTLDGDPMRSEPAQQVSLSRLYFL